MRAPRPLILIVEDAEEMQQLLAALCHASGYDVVLAGTADEGIQYAVLFQPDAILLDIMLPGMRGSEMLRYLRQHAATDHIPVIIVSGYPVTAADGWSSMAAAVLRKPFSIAVLEETLAGVIARRD